jgi:hypothetical protein
MGKQRHTEFAMCETALSPPAREARRLRSALRKQEGLVVMVCAHEREATAIRAELRPRERERVRLLTSWPWDTAALVSLTLCEAA